MKELPFVLTACVVLALVASTGCQPKLAESPYGAKEQQWEEFIKDAFPNWKPPQTVPPARQQQSDSASDTAPPNIIADDGKTEVVIASELVVDAEISKTDVSQGEFQTYTVLKGDTLWKIANKFYGSGTKWRKIYQANQDTLSDPNRVRVGTKIRIPSK